MITEEDALANGAAELSAFDAVDGSHPTASRCAEVRLLLQTADSLLVATSEPADLQPATTAMPSAAENRRPIVRFNGFSSAILPGAVAQDGGADSPKVTRSGCEHPLETEHLSLTMLREKLVRIGSRVVRHHLDYFQSAGSGSPTAVQRRRRCSASSERVRGRLSCMSTQGSLPSMPTCRVGA